MTDLSQLKLSFQLLLKLVGGIIRLPLNRYKIFYIILHLNDLGKKVGSRCLPDHEFASLQIE